MRQKSDQFEEIYKIICNIDGDAIIQSMNLKEILKIFTKNVVDEKILSDLFDFLNTKALEDDDGGNFIQKFVSVLCSRQIESFSINGKIVRHATLEILQKNFQSADHYKRDDMNKFYNSLKLLGEYFNKARIANGSPINILGQSLLNLLNVELEKEVKTVTHFKSDTFAELVLTQMALNGNLLKTRHKTEIQLVLMNIRKCLIELNSMTSKTKAFLLMTLDLYYSNFDEANLEKTIEKVYEPYLLDGHQSKGNAKETKKSEAQQEKPMRNNKQQPTTSHRSERLTSSVPKSPVKPLRPSLRKSETASVQHRPQEKEPKSPQKKVSPKELRTRTSSNGSKTSPRNNHRTSFSPKALHKVESAIDKLQINSSKNVARQNSNNNPTSLTATTDEPTTIPQSTIDETTNIILKQQNSNGNSQKSKVATSKVYFKEENVENLSWNGETSFEDPENPSDPTSPSNQYSNSFLNFLSSNN